MTLNKAIAVTLSRNRSTGRVGVRKSIPKQRGRLIINFPKINSGIPPGKSNPKGTILAARNQQFQITRTGWLPGVCNVNLLSDADR